VVDPGDNAGWPMLERHAGIRELENVATAALDLPESIL
jgi:hypothetical protein